MKVKEWCIALDNVSSYINPVLGLRYKFLKGERATKEKVFSMIPSMTEEEYARYFRPATEEEINGEFEWDGEQYVLEKAKRMKAKIKATGEIINIASYAKITLDKCDSYGNPIELKPEEIELIQEQTVDEHWQDVRERAAIAAMQGVMNFFGSIDYNRETIAKLAVEQADALIEQLKK